MGKCFSVVDVLGFPFAKLDLADTLNLLTRQLAQASPFHVVTANPEILMRALHDHNYQLLLLEADLLTADGTGIIWAARELGTPLPGRVTGVDLTAGLLQYAAENGKSVGLLGGSPGVAEQAAQQMQKRFPALQIPVVHHGYLRDSDPETPARLMREAGVDICLVGMGAPLQEEWIHQHKALTGARLLMGIGGVLDLWAGCQKRAPKIFCNCGLEWAWRLLRQPSRLPRAMAIPRFMLRVKAVKGKKRVNLTDK